MALVFLGLGTNLGEKEQLLNDTIIQISLQLGEVLRQSSFFESKPWGFISDNDFLNAVILVNTNLSPIKLLESIQTIEKQMGRMSKSKFGYADRLIDVDILFYDSRIINLPELKIPHPLITERDFVLVPLCEIAPDFVHPAIGLKISEISLNN